MSLGFDGARLHQRSSSGASSTWADKLGYIVWGEFPDWGLTLQARNVPDSLQGVDRGHRARHQPSVASSAGVRFNERWDGDFPRRHRGRLQADQAARPVAAGHRRLGRVSRDIARHLRRPQLRPEPGDASRQRTTGCWRVPPVVFMNGETGTRTCPMPASRISSANTAASGGTRDRPTTRPGATGTARSRSEEFLDRYKKLTEALLGESGRGRLLLHPALLTSSRRSTGS